MPMPRMLAAACLIALLGGCATSATRNEDATPATKILKPAWTKHDPAAGVIVVKRDRGFSAGGCDHSMALDGERFAELRPGDIVTIYAKPGEHVLSVDATNFICSGSGAVTVVLEAGKRRMFRTAVNASGDVAIMPAVY